MSAPQENPYAAPSATTSRSLSSAERELLVVLLELRDADYLSIFCRSVARSIFNVPFAILLAGAAAFVAYLAVGLSPATLWGTGIAFLVTTMIGSLSRDVAEVATLHLVCRVQREITDFREAERLLHGHEETIAERAEREAPRIAPSAGAASERRSDE